MDLSDHTSADGTAAFANSETQTFFHRDRRNQSHFIDTLSPGITISLPSGNFDRTRHVRRTEVELGTVVAEEWRVTATLVLRQHIDSRLRTACVA